MGTQTSVGRETCTASEGPIPMGRRQRRPEESKRKVLRESDTARGSPCSWQARNDRRKA